MRGSPKQHWARTGARIAFLPLLLFVACAEEAESPPEQEAPPPLEVVDLGRLEAGLAEHRGSGQLVNFWAIWCKPCVAELPDLAEVADQYHDRGGRVVAVSYDMMVPFDSAEAVVSEVETFLETHGYTFPVLIYDADDYDAINERFELPGPVPVTLAINSEGEIVDRQEGSAGADRFREMMEAALSR